MRGSCSMPPRACSRRGRAASTGPGSTPARRCGAAASSARTSCRRLRSATLDRRVVGVCDRTRETTMGSRDGPGADTQPTGHVQRLPGLPLFQPARPKSGDPRPRSRIASSTPESPKSSSHRALRAMARIACSDAIPRLRKRLRGRRFWHPYRHPVRKCVLAERVVRPESLVCGGSSLGRDDEQTPKLVVAPVRACATAAGTWMASESRRRSTRMRPRVTRSHVTDDSTEGATPAAGRQASSSRHPRLVEHGDQRRPAGWTSRSRATFAANASEVPAASATDRALLSMRTAAAYARRSAVWSVSSTRRS